MKIRIKIAVFVVALLSVISVIGQTGTIQVRLLNEDSTTIEAGVVALENTGFTTSTSANGTFTLNKIPYGNYTLLTYTFGKNIQRTTISLTTEQLSLTVVMKDLSTDVSTVEIVHEAERTFGIERLKGIEGTAIYEGKKTEVVVLKDITANLSTNNPRQVYSKITGLNIWESDAVGLQLGIGGRGLSPNRTSNFNTRQNGYDISADALGYPESYYTPPTEALERIEIVRGAASLQYGTQFGGLLNFVMKKGATDKKVEVTSRQTLGSFGYFGSFNSVGGTVANGKLNYYTFYQRKQGNGWRPNSGFYSNTAYARLELKTTSKLTQTFEFTFMDYLAQQPGGLTDAMFAEDARQSVRNRNWFSIGWKLAAWQVDYKVSENTQLNWRTFGLLASRQSLGNLERINVADFGKNRTLIDGKFTNIGHEGRWLQHYRTGKTKHTGVLGYRLYYGQTTNKQGDGNNGSGPDFYYLNPQNLENSDYTFPNYNASVFLENIFNINPRFSITPGVRYEYIQTRSDGYYKQRVFDAAGNLIVDNRIYDKMQRPRSFVIAGIGTKYKLSKNTEWYANASQNYRAINFSDLRVTNPNFIVDTAIQDEKGFTADMGIRGNRAGLFTYEVTAFYIYYKGRIGQVLRADRPPLFIDYRYRTNIADARNLGVELMAELNVWRVFNLPYDKTNQLNVFVNGAFIDARYIKTEDNTIANNKVEMVPPVMVRTGLNYRHRKKAGLSLQYSYTGKHYSDATNATLTSTAVEGVIKSYQVVDVSASFNHKIFSLEISCNNLLDARYYTRRAESYPGPGIIPSDGRSFYATLAITVGK
ncbi:TonB-dependent receptor [Oscillatoria amoena NRMC-F 0135]|nr:TonB-dependent receptor [Oscillatoria amoena NRMC-F 0135]